MPRQSRRVEYQEQSPTPEPIPKDAESSSLLERVNATTESAREKVDHAAHSTWLTVKKYIPSALLHRRVQDYYLMFYNLLNIVLWSYLLVLVTAHLMTPSPPPTILNPSPGPVSSSSTASETLGSYLKNIFRPFANVKTTATGFTSVPPHKLSTLEKGASYFSSVYQTIIERSRTTYSARGIGVYTLIIQSLALLEVVHSATGIVKSPIQTTAMQVASRLAVVWWFVESQPSARTSTFYSTMLVAWSLSEIIRSEYYMASLLKLVPPKAHSNRYVAFSVELLTYIRYSAFYILYPLGSGSEYALLLKGFPPFPSKAAALASNGGWKLLTAKDLPFWKVAFQRVKVWVANWDAGAWARVPFVFIWPAGLFILMTYMQVQREKALGHGSGRAQHGGRLREVSGRKKVQ
ncbi:hypothetical protein FRC17_006941 [Serendipita sp. 399]|nr:hypothetical protein FRC17_006941 [Serendipita sp. 399]